MTMSEAEEQKNVIEEVNNFELDKDVEPSLHIGPEVKCDNIDRVQTSNSYDCVCCVCTKKVK